MNKSVLISGYGSIGRKHANILSRIVKKKKYNYFNKSKSFSFSYNQKTKGLKKN